MLTEIKMIALHGLNGEPEKVKKQIELFVKNHEVQKGTFPTFANRLAGNLKHLINPEAKPKGEAILNNPSAISFQKGNKFKVKNSNRDEVYIFQEFKMRDGIPEIHFLENDKALKFSGMWLSDIEHVTES